MPTWITAICPTKISHCSFDWSVQHCTRARSYYMTIKAHIVRAEIESKSPVKLIYQYEALFRDLAALFTQ